LGHYPFHSYKISYSYCSTCVGGKKNGDKTGAAAMTVTKEELRDIRQKTEKGQKSDAIVIS
jgi:hypothetical protein